VVSESIFFRVLELGGWWENSLTIMEAADQNLQLFVFPMLACFILLWLIAFVGFMVRLAWQQIRICKDGGAPRWRCLQVMGSCCCLSRPYQAKQVVCCLLFVMDGLAGKAHNASLFLFKKMCVRVIELAPIL